MAITVCGNCINFGSQSICVDPAGIYVSGRFDFFGCTVKTQAQGVLSGYSSGGYRPTASDVIEKFPFASDGPSTDVGNLTLARGGAAGQSSTVSGYTSGGGYPYVNPIDKFPFASDSNATDVGDLTIARGAPAGQSSTVSGYSSGGRPSHPSGVTNRIDKFPFASDTNATDVGNLTAGITTAAGQQV